MFIKFLSCFVPVNRTLIYHTEVFVFCLSNDDGNSKWTESQELDKPIYAYESENLTIIPVDW